jgi:Mce-associated membrane protein
MTRALAKRGTSGGHPHGLAQRVTSWALLVTATGFAGWSGWSYWQAGRVPSVSLATERDQVLAAARREIAGLNSLRSADATASLRHWLTITTGSLHDQIRGLNAQYAAAVRQAGRTAVGRVSAIAVTALHPGTAEVIAVVQVSITAANGAAGTQVKRYQADLVLTSGGWKIGSLIAVPA